MPTSAVAMLVLREASGALDGVPLHWASPGGGHGGGARDGWEGHLGEAGRRLGRGIGHLLLFLAVADDDLGVVRQTEVAAKMVDALHAPFAGVGQGGALVYV